MATALDWSMWIGGEQTTASSVIPVYNPEDGSVVGTVPSATREQALAAVMAAKRGAKVAAHMATHERVAILAKAAQLVSERAEEFATLIAQEGSKTIREARKEAMRCAQTLAISAEEARRVTGETIPFDQAPGSEGRVGYWQRGPVGLITAITPFNDPLNLVAHKVGPALAAGNAVIVKPSDETPLSALKLAEVLREAGLPADVLSVVTGRAQAVGEPLVTHSAVRMISFTGGLRTGTAITHQAGLKKIAMELGSNSPVIILGDANLDHAVEATVSGAFWAAGQNCLGVQRVFVEESVYAEVVDRVVARTQRIKMGPKLDETTDMGPLINEREAKRVEDWVAESLRAGARLLTGGTREGTYYAPTVLTDVPDGAIVLEEEIFGPVVSLVPIKSLPSAIEQANSVPYGLQAGVFTRDIQKAFQAVQELEVGGVMINDSSDYRIDAMPFGGVKGSGLGREGVKFAMQDMTEIKVVCFNTQG